MNGFYFYSSIMENFRTYREILKDMKEAEKVTPKQYGELLLKKHGKKQKK